MTSFSSRYDPRRALLTPATLSRPRNCRPRTTPLPTPTPLPPAPARRTPLRHGRPHSRGPSCPCHGPQVTVAGVAAASPASHKDPMACTAIRRGPFRRRGCSRAGGFHGHECHTDARHHFVDCEPPGGHPEVDGCFALYDLCTAAVGGMLRTMRAPPLSTMSRLEVNGCFV